MKAKKSLRNKTIFSKKNLFLGTKAWLLLAMVLSLSYVSLASAISPISQGFSSKNAIPVGSIVGLDKNSTDQVSMATVGGTTSILGVVINSGNTLISLTSGKSNVLVATGGVVQVLASNINGNIQPGDEITASPIAGVGMKATENAEVVGIAQDSLSNSNGSKETYTDSKGQKQTVYVGQIPVQVDVSYYYKQPNKTLIPQAIQNVANAFAGRTVNTAPILISMGIFLVMLIIVASMIYSMIRSSIISVGRNPMSQAAIYRDLLQMSSLVLGVIAVGVVLIYLVLTRF